MLTPRVPRSGGRWSGSGSRGRRPAERFDEIALGLLLDPAPTRAASSSPEVERPSDMLCALWLARRSGLFLRRAPRRAGAAGSRSRLGLVPAFKPASLGHAAYTLATLYANAAYKRHLAARGNAQRVQLEAGAGGGPRAARPPGALVGRGAVGLADVLRRSTAASRAW